MPSFGWIALAATLLVHGAIGADPTCAAKSPARKSSKSTPRRTVVLPRGVVQTASGLRYRVLKPGSGPRPTARDIAVINYTGKLLSGATFDRSTEPTALPVARVVPGFAEALKLMRKGASYRVWIPARLAYGAREMKDGDKVVIPANSVLVFDIDLIDFEPAPPTSGSTGSVPPPQPEK